MGAAAGLGDAAAGLAIGGATGSTVRLPFILAGVAVADVATLADVAFGAALAELFEVAGACDAALAFASAFFDPAFLPLLMSARVAALPVPSDGCAPPCSLD